MGATIGAGCSTWGEDEVRRGRGLRDERPAVEHHDQTPIEQFADFQAPAGIGGAAGPGRHLEPAPAELHGVVACDDAAIATAEDQLEIAWGRAPRRGG